jgi:hypothetical protein
MATLESLSDAILLGFSRSTLAGMRALCQLIGCEPASTSRRSPTVAVYAGLATRRLIAKFSEPARERAEFRMMPDGSRHIIDSDEEEEEEEEKEEKEQAIT